MWPGRHESVGGRLKTQDLFTDVTAGHVADMDRNGLSESLVINIDILHLFQNTDHRPTDPSWTDRQGEE